MDYSRPKYETSYDLSNEGSIIKIVSNKWNVNFCKLPMSYRLDYALYKSDNLRGFCEVKRRKYRKSDFQTYIISLDKVIKARELASITNTKSVLIVSWVDVIGWIDFNNDFVCRQGGRVDRSDWQDVEPMCHFNIQEFKPIVDWRNNDKQVVEE